MAYRYIISDSRETPLARGLLESPVDAEVWYIRILDDGIEAVLDHELLQLVSMDDAAPPMMGRLQRRRDNVIVLDNLKPLDGDVRRNLRVSARFDTYLYPVSGKWKGRIPVISHDLSCGGVAFFCAFPLEAGEELEVVIPITKNPLILRIKVLRLRPSNSKIQLYATKFVDLVREEEAAVREAVFGQQIKNKKAGD